MFGLPEPSGRRRPVRELFDSLRRRKAYEDPESVFFALLVVGALALVMVPVVS